MDYALIDNGTVVNIIYLHPSNAEEFPNAIPLDGYPVGIGDTYEDGMFYHDGVAVKMSADEMNDMKAALNELGVFADE